MKYNVSLIKEEKNWKQHKIINRNLCLKVLKTIIALLPQTRCKEIELVILLTDDNKMRDLNNQFLGKNYATNVLSFPDQTLDKNKLLEKGLENDYMSLGDIAMGYDVMAKEAALQNKTLENHFMHLLIHGILHLLGYDHVIEEEASEMQNLEVQLLKQFEIASPYQNI